jgi:hypothetical protein
MVQRVLWTVRVNLRLRYPLGPHSEGMLVVVADLNLFS